MDQDEVARLVEELKLTSDAGKAVVTIKEEEIHKGGVGGGTRFDRFVVGKIYAARVVNRETLKIHLPKILQTRGEPDIEIVGDNLFVVVFANDRDRQHALVDGQWHFFDNLMLFKEPQGLEKPSNIVFNTFTTWIQCHNLPLICMNPGMIRKIAEHVGEVEEIDVGDGGNCLGQYARARVSRDVNKPLQRCVSITTGETNEKHIILIRYERLPEYCSACGRVGHGVRHCIDVEVDKQNRPFGAWLKASRTVDTRRGRGFEHRLRGTNEYSNSMTRASNDQEEVGEGGGALVVGTVVAKDSDEVEGKESLKGDRVSVREGREKRGDISLSMEVGVMEEDRVIEEGVDGSGYEFMEVNKEEEEKGRGGESENVSTQSQKKIKKGAGKAWKRMAREGNEKKIIVEEGVGVRRRGQ